MIKRIVDGAIFTEVAPWDHVNELDNRTYAVLPYGCLLSASPKTGNIQNTQPVDELKQRYTGFQMRGFQYDFYYRIHVKPAHISLGNLLSEQTRNVEVWNAYLTPKKLASVVESGTEGLALAQPVTAPTQFGGLEARLYTLNISVNGPPVVNAEFTFNFETGPTKLVVTGKRVVVWPFAPQANVSEVLEWKTDILQAYEGEQRLALRPAPRQKFSYNYLLDGNQFSRAKAIATQWGHRVYGVPVWTNLAFIGPLASGVSEITVNTTAADYRADDVILVWDNDEYYEAVETTEVSPSKIGLKLPLSKPYQNAYVMPLRFGRTYSGAKFTRDASDITESNVSFSVTENINLAASNFPKYRDIDVLTDRSVIVSSLDENIIRDVEVIDNSTGTIIVDTKTNYPLHKQKINWHTTSKAELWRVKQWIYSRQGKQKAFWLPSWGQDLTLTEVMAAQSGAFIVRPIGYPLYYGIKDVMLITKSGEIFYRRVLGGSVNDDGNEVLSIDKALGATVYPTDVEILCFMSLVRFDADRVQISHTQAGNAKISIAVVEVPA
ncbi:hypothetical protein [Spartinivicinus ruber]|uniref:hypothetical protein n=1 Tax=Spartinivicinus ruber TaxID=2683272 RepID=UPI0013D84877|nr:hypothetical protein [Spartinivicinus ruber]